TPTNLLQLKRPEYRLHSGDRNLSPTMNLSDKLTDLSLASGPEAMIERIIASDGVFYRFEQRGAPDLSKDEKRDILIDLYRSKPRLFMSRYFPYMIAEDCDCFDLRDYEISFYAKAVVEREKTKLGTKRRETAVRNKRYAEMERLKRESDYFSNSKMREREPLLFDKMVGRFLPEEEQIHLRPVKENDSLSGVFMQFEDSQVISDRRRAHFDKWNEIFKNCGSDSIEEVKTLGKLAQHVYAREYADEDGDTVQMESTSTEGNEEVGESIPKKKSNDGIIEEEEPSSDDDENEEQLKADFMDHMEQRFLRGEDTEFFDYSKVDDRPFSMEFERMRNQDLEDAYFDND
uniref:CCD97-like C-terminal domain-containing protein n=1 Tax=Parascaris univalens TaxID=6257 RepID=A0A915AQL3_PARUN